MTRSYVRHDAFIFKAWLIVAAHVRPVMCVGDVCMTHHSTLSNSYSLFLFLILSLSLSLALSRHDFSLEK